MPNTNVKNKPTEVINLCPFIGNMSSFKKKLLNKIITVETLNIAGILNEVQVPPLPFFYTKCTVNPAKS